MNSGIADPLADLLTRAAQPELTENALADEFTRRHRDDLLYVHEWGKWLRFVGSRWVFDRTIAVHNDARKLVRELGAGIESKKLAARIESAATVNAMTKPVRW